MIKSDLCAGTQCVLSELKFLPVDRDEEWNSKRPEIRVF